MYELGREGVWEVGRECTCLLIRSERGGGGVGTGPGLFGSFHERRLGDALLGAAEDKALLTRPPAPLAVLALSVVGAWAWLRVAVANNPRGVARLMQAHDDAATNHAKHAFGARVKGRQRLVERRIRGSGRGVSGGGIRVSGRGESSGGPYLAAEDRDVQGFCSSSKARASDAHDARRSVRGRAERDSVERRA